MNENNIDANGASMDEVHDPLAYAEKLEDGVILITWKETPDIYEEENESVTFDVKLDDKVFCHLSWFYNIDPVEIQLEMEIVKNEENMESKKTLSKVYAVRQSSSKHMSLDTADNKWKTGWFTHLCSD